jgi:hypothetical protein
MNLNGVRTLVVVVAALLVGVPSATAQESEPSAALLERIRAALQNPQTPFFDSNLAPLVAPIKPDNVRSGIRLGVLTLQPPGCPGQFLCVGVPVGDLVMRAAHSISAMGQRRGENAARKEVAKALAEFEEAQK